MNEFDKYTAQRNVAKEKKKKTLLTGIVICIVLIIVLAVMILYYQSVDAHTFKLYINDVQASSGEGFCVKDENGEYYIRAKDVASYIQWSYQNGEYGSYNEDPNSGYIQNGYEIASFVAGSNTLKKYIQVTATEYNDEVTGELIKPFETNSAEGTLETSTLALPIISQNGQIYFPVKCLSDICNCRIVYENEYRMYIYDQTFLLNLAQVNAANYGFQSVSGIYENMRTLGYGMMVVSNGALYGVVDIYSGQDIIGLKYQDMVFAQNVKEFFVKTTNSNDETSVGIINSRGDSVVKPKNYSNIQILSDNLGLYLVEKDGEYGVLDKEGEVVVHCEYDNIGIPENVLESFDFAVESNKYLLYDDTIIVESNGSYGICDTEGNINKEPIFTGFGYVKDADEDAPKNASDTLLVELEGLECVDGVSRDVKGIIVQLEQNDTTGYGLYDSVSKEWIVPCMFERIYGVTTKGNTEYYAYYSGQTYDLADLLAQNPGEYFKE